MHNCLFQFWTLRFMPP